MIHFIWWKTRELAQQIANEAKILCRFHGLNILTFVGGTNVERYPAQPHCYPFLLLLLYLRLFLPFTLCFYHVTLNHLFFSSDKKAIQRPNVPVDIVVGTPGRLLGLLDEMPFFKSLCW